MSRFRRKIHVIFSGCSVFFRPLIPHAHTDPQCPRPISGPICDLRHEGCESVFCWSKSKQIFTHGTRVHYFMMMANDVSNAEVSTKKRRWSTIDCLITPRVVRAKATMRSIDRSLVWQRRGTKREAARRERAYGTFAQRGVACHVPC